MKWEKIFVNELSYNALISKIYKQLIQLNIKKQTNKQTKNNGQKTWIDISLKKTYRWLWASQVALVLKNLPANAGDTRDAGSDLRVRNISSRRKWQPTPVFLLGEFHGQKSLAGYSPWSHKESDMPKRLTHTHCCVWEMLRE